MLNVYPGLPPRLLLELSFQFETMEFETMVPLSRTPSLRVPAPLALRANLTSSIPLILLLIQTNSKQLEISAEPLLSCANVKRHRSADLRFTPLVLQVNYLEQGDDPMDEDAAPVYLLTEKLLVESTHRRQHRGAHTLLHSHHLCLHAIPSV
jgi:hypothetical protein